MTTTGDCAARRTVAAEIIGLPAGTEILTLAGRMPVEHLFPGDRIVTRTGARVLQDLMARDVRHAPLVEIAPGTLGHDRPDRTLWLPPAQVIELSGPRARALYGRHRVRLPLARLVDGRHLRIGRPGGLRLFRLVFDAPETIYAEGLMLHCLPAQVPA